MFSPRGVAFDLDGTLFDTRLDIAVACNHALAASGRKPLPAETIFRYIGDGSRRLCARAAGLTESDGELDGVVQSYTDYYWEHAVVHTRWMPHAESMLDQLRHLPLAICTNKSRTVAERMLEDVGARRHFTVIVGEGDTVAGKPSGEPLVLVACRLGIDPRLLVMVGDGPQDVLSGRAAGSRTIGFSGGYNTKAALRLADPDVIVGSLDEVAAIVARWRESTVRTIRA